MSYGIHGSSGDSASRSGAPSLLIRGGRVWQDGRLREADILVRDGHIAAVGQVGETSEHVESLDARGLVILPGFIDVHTHIDDCIGGFTLADDFSSGTRCAVENGITTLGTFVTESTDIPLQRAFASMAERAAGNLHCDLVCHITPTRFDDAGWRVIDEILERGVRTMKLYTTYRQAGIYSDYDQIERVFAALGSRLVRVLVHCEDDMLLSRAAADITLWNQPLSHAQARPVAAEVAGIRAVLERAEAQHARLHIVHVSTPEGVDLVGAAKRDLDVTCETAPQYLTFDAGWLEREDGHRWICSPPLRSPALRVELVQRALQGSFDLFATDHCAFHKADKDSGKDDCRLVPNGLPGIGALPHVIYRLFQRAGGDGLFALATHLSENPARMLGLFPRKGSVSAGADADLVFLAPDGPNRPVRSSLADTHEPYKGMDSGLTMQRVLLRGVPVVENGKLRDPGSPRGACLWEI